MRRRFLAEIGPNGTWPENPGVSGGAGTPAVDPFSWIRWENRGLADVVMSIDGAIEAPGGTPNPHQYWDYIPAGECNVRNIGKPAATELHLRNVDGANNALVWIELDTEPIVDLGNTRILLDRSRKTIASTNPLAENLAQIAGAAVATLGGSLVTSGLLPSAIYANYNGTGSYGPVWLTQAISDAPQNASPIQLQVAAIQYLMNLASATAERARTPTIFKTIAALAVVAGTPAAIWTPATGKKFRLMGWMLSLSVAGSVILKDAAAELHRTPLMAAGIGLAAPAMGNGQLSAAANNALNADVSATGSISGFVFGTEE